MKKLAPPGFEVTRPLHADCSDEGIYRNGRFFSIGFEDQVKVLNYESNFQGSSEVVNT